MEDKPYYEQEYHEPKTDIPRPTFGQAFKLLFTAPFKWNARSTRRGFWYAYVWAIILLVILAACSATAYSIDGIAYSSNEFFLLTHVSTGTHNYLSTDYLDLIRLAWLYHKKIA